MVSRWFGSWIAVALALLAPCARSAPAAAAPPAWAALAGRGGQVTVEPLKADTDGTRLPAYAARIRIEPGAVRSGFRSDGAWLGELLATAPHATTLALRIRLTAPGPVALAVSCPGMDGVTDVPVLPRGGEPQELYLPLARTSDPSAPRLVLTTGRPCTIEMLEVEPTVAETGLTAEQWARASEMAGLREAEVALLRDLALCDVLPTDGATPLLRAWGDLFRRADAEALQQLAAQLDEGAYRADDGELWLRVAAKLSRVERRLDWMARTVGLPDAVERDRREVRWELARARRGVVAGERPPLWQSSGAGALWRVNGLAVSVLGPVPSDACDVGPSVPERDQPVLRDGRLDWRDGAAFVPIPFEANPGWAFDAIRGDGAGATLPVWAMTVTDAELRGSTAPERLVGDAQGRLYQARAAGWPVVLRVTLPPASEVGLATGKRGLIAPSMVPEPWTSACRLAASAVSQCADTEALCGLVLDAVDSPARTDDSAQGAAATAGPDLPDLLDRAWAAERQRADDLVEAVREVAPTLPLMMAPANPAPDLPRLQDVLAAACGPVGNPSAIGLPQSPLARRLAASAAGSGLRTTRVTALDQGRVPVPVSRNSPLSRADVATGTLRVVAQSTSDRPHRVAVVCSAREVVLERSKAMALVELLRHLDVDADLLVDLELAHSGKLPRVYKALVYEMGSLDERAFTVAWRSGLPVFLIGAPGEDRRGEPNAAAVLESLGAFLARPTGNWRPTETVREIPLPKAEPTVLADPLELALGAGWLRADAPPAPAQESPASLGLSERAWLSWQVWTLPVSAADAAMGGRLLVPSRLPVGCQIVLNGELLGQGLDGPIAEDNPLDAMTLAVRPGLLRGDIPNRLALGVRHGQTLRPGLAQAIRFVPEPLMTMRVAEALGPMAANEEQTCWTPAGTPAFPPTSLVREARAITVEKTSGRPLLIRQSNSLLWAGALPTGSPVLERMVSAFLANLGEAHVYPPSPQTARTEITDTPGGVLVYRKDGDPVEIVLGGRSLLVPAAGVDPDHQRIGGATVVGFRPAEPLGSLQAFRRTELEVVPDSGEVTVTALTRDFARPERLAFQLTTAGPASRLVLHSPFASAPQCTALIDGSVVDVRRRGANWELRVPQGTHQVELSAYCQAVLDELLREPEQGAVDQRQIPSTQANSSGRS